MQLDKAVRLFLHSYFEQSDRSSNTLKAYECDLRQFSQFLTNDPTLDSVRAEDCEAWIEHLKQIDYSASSRKRKVATLRCFFNECVRRNRIAISPFQQLRFRFPTGNQLPKSLSISDACAVLKQARQASDTITRDRIQRLDREFLHVRNWVVIEILIATGLRVGELTALRTGDVDLVQRTLMIRGKGGRERLAFLVDDSSFDSLKAYLEIRNRISCDNNWLLLNARGGRLSEQGVAHVLCCLAKKAGLSRKLTPHMLRHTAATLLLQNGVDIRIVQEFLGHTSISTTQRYAHVTRDHLRATLMNSHHCQLLTYEFEKPLLGRTPAESATGPN